jgi:hypothetical protein
VTEHWQEAIDRSFTGEQFDEQRPLKDVAKAIRGDLLAAMVQGVIPADRYRVTVRQERYYAPRIYVYAWAAHEVRTTVEQLTRIYNRCQERPRMPDPGDSFEGYQWHFRVYVEWPDPWKSRPKAEYGSREDYEAACKQAQAEAEAWGQAYVAKHQGHG